jgi:hypothetical protein
MGDLHTIFWGLLIAAGCSAVAYFVGRRIGIRQGRRDGIVHAPLNLRRQALETGVCPVCDDRKWSCYNVSQER